MASGSPLSLRRPSRGEWNALRPRLTTWYIQENHTARHIKSLLQVEGYDVSVKILRDRFAEWSLRKNSCSSDASPRCRSAPSPVSENLKHKAVTSPNSPDFRAYKRQHQEHEPHAKRICVRERIDGAASCSASSTSVAASSVSQDNEQESVSLTAHHDDVGFDTSTVSSSPTMSDDVAHDHILPTVEEEQRAPVERPESRDSHIKAILERQAGRIYTQPSMESQDMLESLTLDLIAKWCREFRDSKADVSNEHIPCKVYKLLDDCKTAVGGACGYNAKTFWDRLLDVDARAQQSWEVKRPESFLLALYGLLRLLEQREGREDIIKTVIDVLAISSLRVLGDSHPMALLFRMAAWGQISLRLCSKVWDILETEHISQAKGDVHVLRARLSRCFGNVLINLKRYDDAESFFNRAYKSAKSGSDSLAVVEAYCGLARMKRYQGQPEAAQDFLQKALEHLRETRKGGSSIEVKVLFKSAYAYTLMGEAAASEQTYRQALRIHERSGYKLVSSSDYIVIVRTLHDALARQGKMKESRDLEGLYPDAFEER